MFFFVMNVAVLCYNKHTDPTKLYNALCICIPEANLKKCSNVAGGYNIQTHRSKWYIRKVSENFLCFNSSGQDQKTGRML